MTNFEDELSSRLATQADGMSVADDWGDLVERMSRSARRTTRALSLSLALVLCLGGVAVVIAARHDNGGGAQKTATGRLSQRPLDGVVPTHAAVPTVPAGTSPGTVVPSFTKGGVLTTLDPVGGTSIGIAVGPMSGIGVSTPMAKVFTRTTASGVAIRAYRADVASQSTAGGPPWWTPPGWCFPNGYVQADVSDDAVAGVGSAPLYGAQKDGSKLGGVLTLIGQNEQSVRWIVLAQGPPDAATLRVTFPDGSTDAMTPVDGVAVLVGHGEGDLQKAKVTLTALNAAGATLATKTVSGVDGVTQFGPECSSPQTLPAAGAQQPADAAAARQAVVDVFDHAYVHGVNDATLFGYFDDSHGFADVLAKLRAGSFKEQVRTAQLKFTNLVFLSPTVAAIQYEIDIPGYSIPSFAPRFNEAHLVNGQWKLARQGFCNDVGLAGAQCPK